MCDDAVTSYNSDLECLGLVGSCPYWRARKHVQAFGNMVSTQDLTQDES